ncbi:DUF397 domain-containing protein [Actinoplanes sp. NPDC000266]
MVERRDGEGIKWRRSSRCSGDACIEVADISHWVVIAPAIMTGAWLTLRTVVKEVGLTIRSNTQQREMTTRARLAQEGQTGRKLIEQNGLTVRKFSEQDTRKFREMLDAGVLPKELASAIAEAGGVVLEEGVAVRDSKNPGAPALTFTRSDWHAFLDQVASGFPER